MTQLQSQTHTQTHTYTGTQVAWQQSGQQTNTAIWLHVLTSFSKWINLRHSHKETEEHTHTCDTHIEGDKKRCHIKALGTDNKKSNNYTLGTKVRLQKLWAKCLWNIWKWNVRLGLRARWGSSFIVCFYVCSDNEKMKRCKTEE